MTTTILISFAIHIVAIFWCLYLLLRYKTKLWLQCFFLSILLSSLNGWKYFAQHVLNLPEPILSFTFLLSVFLKLPIFVLIIWILINDSIVQNKKKKEWTEFLEKLLKGVDFVKISMVIERDGKFLLLESKFAEELDIPGNDELVTEKTDITKSSRRGLKEKTGLLLIKLEHYLGVFGKEFDDGRKVRFICYLIQTKHGEIGLDKKVYNDYYWISPNDEKFKSIPEPVQVILLRAQEYLNKNPHAG